MSRNRGLTPVRRPVAALASPLAHLALLSARLLSCSCFLQRPSSRKTKTRRTFLRLAFCFGPRLFFLTLRIVRLHSFADSPSDHCLSRPGLLALPVASPEICYELFARLCSDYFSLAYVDPVSFCYSSLLFSPALWLSHCLVSATLRGMYWVINCWAG